MSFDPEVMAAMMLGSWYSDDGGTSHYAQRVSTRDTNPRRSPVTGMPIMNFAVQALCGAQFLSRGQPGNQRCSRCLQLRGGQEALNAPGGP